jgi:hypothetical protein
VQRIDAGLHFGKECYWIARPFFGSCQPSPMPSQVSPLPPRHDGIAGLRGSPCCVTEPCLSSVNRAPPCCNASCVCAGLAPPRQSLDWSLRAAPFAFTVWFSLVCVLAQFAV